ncbi:MAG: hypothetical protein AAF460_07215, partial [Pseudomonadota bacterium]
MFLAASSACRFWVVACRQTNGRGKRYDSVLDTVGDTPTIRINRIAPNNVTVYVKFEAFNPA